MGVRLRSRSSAYPHADRLGLGERGDALRAVPYVRGESLRQKLAREKCSSIEDTLRIARQVGGALEYAHRVGVIHRDIKPDNILMHEGEAVLADFGIALAVQEAARRLTETGASLGTPEYVSPEQAAGDRVVDARAKTPERITWFEFGNEVLDPFAWMSDGSIYFGALAAAASAHAVAGVGARRNGQGREHAAVRARPLLLRPVERRQAMGGSGDAPDQRHFSLARVRRRPTLGRTRLNVLRSHRVLLPAAPQAAPNPIYRRLDPLSRGT